MELLQWLQSAWGVIAQHPWVFGTGMVIAAGLGWSVAKWLYNHQISNQAATNTYLETQLNTLRSQVGAGVDRPGPDSMTEEEPSAGTGSLKPEPFIPYNRDWNKACGYYLWQASWLWIGEEPQRGVRSGTRMYPVYSRLKQAASAGQLPFTPAKQGGQLDAGALLTRDDLKFYARMYGDEIPAFLAGDI